MRSRVTPKTLPTSSRVWSPAPPIPNRMRVDRVRRRDQIAQGRVPVLADWNIKRSRLLHHRQNLLHARDRNAGARRDLRRRRLPSMPLIKLSPLAQDFGCRLRHVNGDANGAALVSNGAGDGLSDPPHGISRDLHAMAVVELFNRVHEAQVAFLDQIEEVEGAIAAILFGDCDHQSEMSSYHFLARRRQRSPRAIHLSDHDPQVGDRKAYALSQRREVLLQGLNPL